MNCTGIPCGGALTLFRQNRCHSILQSPCHVCLQYISYYLYYNTEFLIQQLLCDSLENSEQCLETQNNAWNTEYRTMPLHYRNNLADLTVTHCELLRACTNLSVVHYYNPGQYLAYNPLVIHITWHGTYYNNNNKLLMSYGTCPCR